MFHPPSPFAVRVSHTAAKEFRKIPQPAQGRIKAALQELGANPYQGKALKGELAGLYSLRVWPYRIIYRVTSAELLVEVIDIGHRQGVYK